MNLIYYDSNGVVYSEYGGDYDKPPEMILYAVEYEMPKGYRAQSVNPETKEVTIEKSPFYSLEEKVKELEEQLNALLAVDEGETTE